MAGVWSMRTINIRKNQGFEALFIAMIILLAVGMALLVINKAWKEVKPELDTGLNSAIPANSGHNVSKVLEQTSGGALAFDKLIPFLVIGIFSFVIIAGGTIMRSPIMIIVGIIILGVVLTLSVIYSNVYYEISSSDSFSDVNSDMGIQNKFMQYLPVIMFLLALVLGIAVMWFKGGGSPGL